MEQRAKQLIIADWSPCRARRHARRPAAYFPPLSLGLLRSLLHGLVLFDQRDGRRRHVSSAVPSALGRFLDGLIPRLEPLETLLRCPLLVSSARRGPPSPSSRSQNADPSSPPEHGASQPTHVPDRWGVLKVYGRLASHDVTRGGGCHGMVRIDRREHLP